MADKQQKPWERGIIGYTRNFFGRLVGRPPRDELGDLGTGSPAIGRQARQLASDARASINDVLPGSVMTSAPVEGAEEELEEREVGGRPGKRGGFDRAEAAAEREAVESAEAEADRHGKRHGPPPHARGRALGHKKGHKA